MEYWAGGRLSFWWKHLNNSCCWDLEFGQENYIILDISVFSSPLCISHFCIRTRTETWTKQYPWDFALLTFDVFAYLHSQRSSQSGPPIDSGIVFGNKYKYTDDDDDDDKFFLLTQVYIGRLTKNLVSQPTHSDPEGCVVLKLLWCFI